MTTTGWYDEDAERPALPLTARLLANRERGPGDALEIAAARSRAADARELREAADAAPDPDARAADLVTRGVLPGMTSDLSRRLGDTLAELQTEREKIERGQRRAEQVMRAHRNGQVTAFDIARMDLDEGDPGKVAQLERRAEALQLQIGEAAERMSAHREREVDPLEAASRHAHAVFVEATRAKMAEARAGRSEPRPFGSVSRGGLAVRSDQCVHCTSQGVDPETSFLLHSDPERNVPVTTAEQATADAYPGEPARSAVPDSYGVVMRGAASGGPILGVR